MSAERLRAMLSRATPGPWEVTDFGDGKPKKYVKLHFGGGHSFTTLVHSYENARLIALAPDAIALLADMGEQMEAFGEILTRSRSPIAEIDERMRNLVAPMMARLDALCGDER